MTDATTIVPSDTHIQVEGAEGSTNMMQLITVRSALGFEIKTGMKMTRVSALVVAQRITGCTRNKKKAWEAVNFVIGEVRPDMKMETPW